MDENRKMLNWLLGHPKKFSLIGLGFGFLGAILLAFSVVIVDPWVPPPALTHATINQVRFRLGVGLLAMGFFLQIVDTIREK